jgi:Glycosyl transferase WecG/TagA/CpsF family
MAEPMVRTTPLQWRRILRTRVDATSHRHTTDQVLRWAAAGQSRYVCVATVNNLIEGCDDPGYNTMMEAADLVTPDGMPLVWGLRLLEVAGASRVYGPDRWSPPFRALTDEEEARVTEDLRRSGTRVLFVGLGTPKQERWMARPPAPAHGHGRGRGGLRLPVRAQAPGAAVAPESGAGVAVPSGPGAATAVAALPVPQPQVRRPVRGPAAARTATRKERS